HRDRRECADVLRARGCAENRADEPEREDQLGQHRLPIRDPGSGLRGAERTVLAVDSPEEQARERGAEQLGKHVPGEPPPGESAAKADREGHRRIQMCSRDRAHEEDDRQHRQSRRSNRCGPPDLTVAQRADDDRTGAGKYEQKGAEQLREEPAPFEPRVVEVIEGRKLEREQVPAPPPGLDDCGARLSCDGTPDSDQTPSVAVRRPSATAPRSASWSCSLTSAYATAKSATARSKTSFLPR